MLYNEYLVQVRHEELLDEAERYRLISQAQRRSARKKYSYALALAWLGIRLCNWGNRLQERFGDAGRVGPSQAVKSGI